MIPKFIPDITTYKEIKYPCSCEVKYDGIFCYWDGRNMWNKRGIEQFTITELPELALYGELYYGEGKEFYSEIHSHQGYKNEFIAFDTGAYGLVDYTVRRNQLENIKKFGFDIVEAKVCSNEHEMQVYYDKVVARGFEGIVAKPLDEKTDRYWVKKKREFNATVLVKGLRKNKSINTIAIGTCDEVLGHCSLNGWDLVTNMLSKEQAVITSQDKDNWYINSAVKLEIKHNGFTPSGKFRNPVIKRIRDYESEVCV